MVAVSAIISQSIAELRGPFSGQYFASKFPAIIVAKSLLPNDGM